MLLKSRKRIVGLPPGSVVFTGQTRSEAVDISLINYTESAYEEKKNTTVQESVSLQSLVPVSWVNVNGIHDEQIIEQLGALIGLHPLVMEDLVHLDQRPKLEEYDGYLFIVFKMLHYDNDKGVRVEQVSLVVSDSYVISFQEYAGDVLEPIRERIRKGKGRIRKMGADYLGYALMDTVVDHYFLVVEKIGVRIEGIEAALFEQADKAVMQQISELRKDIILLKRTIWPLREISAEMQRLESTLFKKKTSVYLRDLYDHIIQVIDMLETMSDLLASLTDLYISAQSLRMNEVMKFLTMIGTIFIPLTFVAGIYGMNFAYMPELQSEYGYPLILLVMGLIGGGFLVYLKRRGWL